MAERINRAVDAVASALVIACYVGLPVYLIAGLRSALVTGAMAGLGSLMQTYNLHAPVVDAGKTAVTTMIGGH